MNCSRCGSANEPGDAFCKSCGAPLAQVPTPQGYDQQGYTSQGYSLSPQGYVPPKKKRAGLIIGLVAGGVVLAGALAAAYFLFLSGPDLNGLWVCENRGWALRIENNTLTEYSPAGTDNTDCNYRNGEGEAELNDGSVSFEVNGDRMNLTGTTGDRYLFTRDMDADPESVVLAGFEGLWSSEKLGEVVKLDEEGGLMVYSGTGELSGRFDFNIKSGRGTIMLRDKVYAFSADWNKLTIETVGDYNRAKKNLDVDAFIRQYGNPLLATWYETTGNYGDISFKGDGTFALELYGQTVTGAYTYDFETGTGTITSDKTGETVNFTYADGTLTMEGLTYTQKYVAQPGADDMFAEIKGIWYDIGTEDEAVTFNSDGTVKMVTGGNDYTGTFTFNPLELNGLMTVSDGENTVKFNFYLDGGALHIDNKYTYSRQQPETIEPAGTILGTWYDKAGYMGTLYFDKDGLVVAESSGLVFYGTYTFDESTGTGKMTIQYDEGPMDFSLHLTEGELYTDQATYTKDNVEQAS